MNENIDLTVILKNCPRGWKFYSKAHGEVEFAYISVAPEKPIVVITKPKNYEPLCKTFTPEGHLYNMYETDECLLVPSKDQQDWSKFSAPWYKKEESIKPKFKAGDKIRHKETNKDDVYEINKVYDDSYAIGGFNWMLYMKYQDQYELVPNKFDPKTLKPFDKVMCKNGRLDIWHCDFFSSYVETCVCRQNCCISGSYSCCIPYNDDTKHLVGTKDEAPEYYRYWED